MATHVTEPWRSRIVGHGEEDPAQLLANPLNHRIHPKAQQDVMAGILDTVGYVEEVIVNVRTGFLINGHMRVAMALSKGQPTVPVTRVDLTDDEERLVLATFDRIGAQAIEDQEQLDMLLADVREMQIPDIHLVQFLADISGKEPKDKPEPSYDADLYGVIIECADEREQVRLLQRFQDEGLVCRALVS